jgi:ferredoxin-NADP reductase
MSAPSHRVVLKGSEAVAEGTMMFRLARPPGFSFAAGQAVDLSLLDPPSEPNSSHRLLSLVSAPFEGDLAVATRMREASAFKRALGTLPPGATVGLKGPQGVMTLHEDPARAAVFIAGGIGITPFMSMLRQAAHDRVGHRFFLLYSNRRPEHAAFLRELQDLEQQYDHFRLLARMTDHDGFLDEETITSFIAGAKRPLYYLAGPPAMADAMTRILRGAGVRDEDISSEEFYGY